MKTIIKNGYLLDPATKTEGNFDILIEDGIVAKVDKNIDSGADNVIDAKDMIVMPGFIDMHVHLREPGYEYKETIKTGSMAAARGGFTSICPMPNTNPVIDNKEMVNYILEKAEEESLVNILPVGAITKGQEGKELADISGMEEAGIVAVSEDGKSVMSSRLYQSGMVFAKDACIPVLAHCEDKVLAGNGVMNQGEKSEELGLEGISNAVEDIIVARDILLAKEVGVRLHLCHCSTEDSVNLVRFAKQQNLSVTAEVCPHHFTLSEEDITSDDANFKMNPPLRNRIDVEALKVGLRDNIMDVIATDHAPHSESEKKKSIKDAPFGIVGMETAFSLSMTELVKQGYITLMQLVEKLSFNPAKILGIDRGSLAVGKIADIVIADPKVRYKIDSSKFLSKGKNTPFNGKEVIGRVEKTLVAGVLVYENDDV